jgi:hypothetical protein
VSGPHGAAPPAGPLSAGQLLRASGLLPQLGRALAAADRARPAVLELHLADALAAPCAERELAPEAASFDALGPRRARAFARPRPFPHN